MNTKPEEVTAALLKDRLALTSYFSCVTKDFHLAEDIFQEVCVKAVTRAQDFESARHAVLWARVTGRNRAIDLLRSQRGNEVQLSENMLTTLADEWPSDAQVDALRTALAECLPVLTSNNRELLRLRYFEQRSCGEVAAILARKLETVYQSLSRIHRTLGDCIRKRLAQEALA